MKTLHRIRHNINITFANFQACVIFGFLDMGIFMWIADQFMWLCPTSAVVSWMIHHSLHGLV